MINAQIANTLVSLGQTAQSLQGTKSGSGPVRTQEPAQDTSDLTVKNTVSSKDTQDGKAEAPSDSKDFEHALNARMAESKQEESPEESPEDSQDPTILTLQTVMVPVQISAQPLESQPGTLIQTIPVASVAPEPTALMPTEPPLANQALAQDAQSSQNTQNGQSSQSGMVNGPVMPQMPGVSPVPTATDMPLGPVKDPTKSNVPMGPTPPTPELVSAQATESIQESVLSQSPKNTQAVTETITQDTPAQREGFSTEQVTSKPVEPQTGVSDAAGPQSKQTDTMQPLPVATEAQKTLVTSRQTDTVQPQSVMTQTQKTPVTSEPPQPQPLPVTSESKPELTSKPLVDIQSVPQGTSQRVEGQVEPLRSPAQQKPPAEALKPIPIQVTHPIQQAVTAKLESSHEQPIMTKSPDTSETEGGLQPTQSTTPVIGLSETQAASTSTEASLPRSLDPATTSVARQIQDSMAQGIQQDSRQIIIRLDPPELGRVAIRFQEGDDGITGVLEVQRSQTRHEIQRALPEIILHLQNSGVQIKRIEVLLSADADLENFEDQAFAQAQDQNLEQQQTSGNRTTYRSPSIRWSSSSDPGVSHSIQEQYVSDQGINMLI